PYSNAAAAAAAATPDPDLDPDANPDPDPDPDPKNDPFERCTFGPRRLRFRGAFRDPTIEADFQRDLAARMLPRSNAVAVCAASLVTGYALAAYFLIDDPEIRIAYTPIITMHLASVTILVVAALVGYSAPVLVARRAPYLHVGLGFLAGVTMLVQEGL
ncbi:hypothetical protein HK405_002128, partial [Cladochytrium tenue]